MPRPVHFEIPADRPERAVQFYGDVFGWTFQKWEGPMPYWLVSTGSDDEPGINGGLGPRQHPGQGPTNAIGVDSVDAFLEKVEKAGGTCVVPKMAVPGAGWVAYCHDTEGNTFGLWESDPSAA